MKEIWKDVKDYEGLYKISNLGRVLSVERDSIDKNGFKHHVKAKILTPRKHNHGYRYVTLCKTGSYINFLIHRLVGIHFIDNPKEKRCINHKNGNKTDNVEANLEWCTHGENNLHANKNGLVDRNGEKNGKAKLTVQQVKYIRSNYVKGSKDLNCKYFAEMFDVSEGAVNSVVLNKSWYNVK